MFKSLLSLLLFIHCASLGFAQSESRVIQKWAFNTGGAVDSIPAFGSDGTIYVGSYDNKLYAINPDGSKKWAFETGDEVHSSPAIGSDGTIYVGSYDANFYALKTSSTGPADSPWPMFGRNARRTGFSPIPIIGEPVSYTHLTLPTKA